MLKRFKVLLFGTTLLSMASIAEVEAATKEWIGCPIKSFYAVDPGPMFSVSWSVTGEELVISFQADKILLGGGKGMMSASQLAQWAPYLDELRAAASQRVKLQVFYDDSTRVILAINVLYNQKCYEKSTTRPPNPANSSGRWSYHQW